MIIILTILVSAAIPIMAPTNDDRRIREAVRLANAYITGAQMKAIESQRPYGVMIKRLSQNTNSTGNPNDPHDDNAVSIELQYVEQPSPYVGFSESSSARVALHTPANINTYNRIRPLVRIQFLTRGNAIDTGMDGLPPGWDADAFPDSTIRPGDMMEINGTRYELLYDLNDPEAIGGVEPRLTGSADTMLFYASNTGKYQNDPNNAVTIVARPVNDTGQLIAVKYDNRGRHISELVGVVPGAESPFWTEPAPYKILRQPMPTSADPLQMPDGTAIDLRASGIGINDYFYVPGLHDRSDPIFIMFAPEGRVSRLKFDRRPSNGIPFDEPVVDNIFLLVGRRELAPPVAIDNDPMLLATPPNVNSEDYRKGREAINWLRGESRWIAIGSQSGRIVSVENAFVNVSATNNKYLSPPTVQERSEQLRNGQILEARGFARQMSQLGGR